MIYKLLLYGIIAFAWVLLIGPYCISAQSDTLSIGWILITLFGGAYFINKLIKDLE